jgi:hypothetical protein
VSSLLECGCDLLYGLFLAQQPLSMSASAGVQGGETLWRAAPEKVPLQGEFAIPESMYIKGPQGGLIQLHVILGEPSLT